MRTAVLVLVGWGVALTGGFLYQAEQDKSREERIELCEATWFGDDPDHLIFMGADIPAEDLQAGRAHCHSPEVAW